MSESVQRDTPWLLPKPSAMQGTINSGPICHAVPENTLARMHIYRRRSLAWARDQFGERFEDLTAHAESAPVGSDGLFFMPWFQGAATPNPDSHARAGVDRLDVAPHKGTHDSGH